MARGWQSILSEFEDTREDPDAKVPGAPPRRTGPTMEDPLEDLKPTFWKIDGEDQEFYTIGEVAKALRRQPVTIRSWEAKGWLPKPRYRTPSPKGEQIPGKASKGRRLYTRDQVLYLMLGSERFKLNSPRDADWNGFRQYMNEYPQTLVNTKDTHA